MTNTRYITEPRFHEGPGVAISVVFDRAEPRDIAAVVVIGRAAGQPPMTANEVDAELADRADCAFPVTSRPQGTLPEGGGMGVSVNARFRFRIEGGDPAKLRVRYAGQTYTFLVKEAA